MKTAILVDGGFYRRLAYNALGDKSPKERADELISYCHKHLNWRGESKNNLYRIFYYDCPPLNKQVYHPLLGRTIDLSKTGTFQWSLDFYEELSKRRKVALRMGEMSDIS